MENWYCKEFLSSSQTAARLVFNIDNSVNLNKVLYTRPTRPPDPKGRESFIYIMDGSVIHHVKDLTIDELSPWNSRKCKSSTRFNSIQVDHERNTLVFNRYIISDGTNAPTKPECLFACYYCKHPIFDLVKKIFYACDGNREHCLPGTFVIFVYEFNQAQHIYSTYRRPNSSFVPISGDYKNVSTVNCSFSDQSVNSSMSIHNSPKIQSQSSAIQKQESSINPVQRHFLESDIPLKLEDLADFTEWTENMETAMDGDDDKRDIANNGFNLMDKNELFAATRGAEYLQKMEDMPDMPTSSSSTSCLEELLQSCNQAVNLHQQQQCVDQQNTFSMMSNSFKNNDERQQPNRSIVSRKRAKITFRALESQQQQQPDLPFNTTNDNPTKKWRHELTMIQNHSSRSALNAANSISFPSDSANHMYNSTTMAMDAASTSMPIIHNDNFSDAQKTNFQGLFILDDLLENFCHNGLCDEKKLSEELDTIDECFMRTSKMEKRDRMEAICKTVEHSNVGGCLLVDTEFCYNDKLRCTFIWFRNLTFVDSQTNLPVIHPVAVHIAGVRRRQFNCGNDKDDDTRQILLNGIYDRLGKTCRGKICRSLMIRSVPKEISNLDSWSSSLQSPLFEFPCIRLIPMQQVRQWLYHKFVQLNGSGNDENINVASIKAQIELEFFHKDNGILESVSFEEFVSRQRAVERGWPNAFRTWFREKSGWIFERCSLGSRLKARFSVNEQFDLDTTLEQLRTQLCECFDFVGFDCEAISEIMEHFCMEFLRNALDSVILNDTSEAKNVEMPQPSVKLSVNKRHFWIGTKDWEAMSVKERCKKLAELGISSLLIAIKSLGPAVFLGLDNSQRHELFLHANSLIVQPIIDDNRKEQNSDVTPILEFVVLDKMNRTANFVTTSAGEHGSVMYCQCRGTNVSGTICAHIFAVALKHSHFEKIVKNIMNENMLMKNVAVERQGAESFRKQRYSPSSVQEMKFNNVRSPPIVDVFRHSSSEASSKC